MLFKFGNDGWNFVIKAGIFLYVLNFALELPAFRFMFNFLEDIIYLSARLAPKDKARFQIS